MAHKIIYKKIKGAYELIGKPFKDQRGIFLNSYRYQENEFQETWGDRPIKQINISETFNIGVIRGMHLQKGIFKEAKLIRCIKGRIFDVIVDLRRNSDTFGEWCSVELSKSKYNSFLIPEGCAHGFQVLEEGSQILYIHSNEWNQNYESGVIFNDPKIDIKWPLNSPVLSKKDLLLPTLDKYEF